MLRYEIKSFNYSVPNVGLMSFNKDGRTDNYIAGERRMNLMDFMCLPNSHIRSIAKRVDRTNPDPQIFTIGDMLNLSGRQLRITCIRIINGDAHLYCDAYVVGLNDAVRWVTPPSVTRTPIPPVTPTTPPATSVNDIAAVERAIVSSFSGRQIRILGILRRRTETVEEFLHKFFTDWNNDERRDTVFVDDRTVQTRYGKRRSLGDLYMLVKYYYPSATLNEVLDVLYNKLPRTITTGFRTSRCSEIHKRVWYYTTEEPNGVLNTNNEDEYSHLYSWYVARIVPTPTTTTARRTVVVR